MSVTSRLVLACTIAALRRHCGPGGGPGPFGRTRGSHRDDSRPSRHREVLHDLGRQPGGRGSRPGHAARGRQRRRCRHRRAAGSQPGRAAVLGARRRRIHPALGRGQPEARRLRRAGDGAGRGNPGPVPGRGPSAQVRRGRVRRPERRRARYAARSSKPCTSGTAGCPGRGCLRRRSGSPRRAFAFRRACTCCCAGRGRTLRAGGARATSSTAPAAPGRSATCSRTRSSPRPCAPLPRAARTPSTRAPIAQAIVEAVRAAPNHQGDITAGRSRRLQREGARARLRRLPALPRLRHGAALLGRPGGGAGPQAASNRSTWAQARPTP